jgi:hypothetical protein
MFPNRCDFAESGYAGSKFSTVVLSGNSYEQDNIEPRAYQVIVIDSLLITAFKRFFFFSF